VLALVLAVLYFGLIELLMIDSARELSEARRFRARIMAETLAENGAELAAREIITQPSAHVTAQDWQGTIEGHMVKKSGGQFEITAAGTTTGLTESVARVRVFGQIYGTEVRIQYTIHSY